MRGHLDEVLNPILRLYFRRMRGFEILHCHLHRAISVIERIRDPKRQRLLFDYQGTLTLNDVNRSGILDMPNWSPNRKERWEASLLAKANGISFVTETLRRRMCKIYALDYARTYVIPDGVDCDYVARNLDENIVNDLRKKWHGESRKIVMYVGLLDEQHGARYLSTAVSGMLADCRLAESLSIVIVGSGPFSPQFEVLQEKNPDHLFFMDRVAYRFLPSYLAAADVLLSPHPRNLIMDSVVSSKVLHYLASERPAVVTRLAGTSQWLHDGQDAVFCEPEDPSTMVEAVKGLVSDDSRSHRIGKAGALLARTNFDWSIAARKAEEVYRIMIDSQQAI
jgi:glycosyltransferase involved in cell wall biosynthesis